MSNLFLKLLGMFKYKQYLSGLNSIYVKYTLFLLYYILYLIQILLLCLHFTYIEIH